MIEWIGSVVAWVLRQPDWFCVPVIFVAWLHFIGLLTVGPFVFAWPYYVIQFFRGHYDDHTPAPRARRRPQRAASARSHPPPQSSPIDQLAAHIQDQQEREIPSMVWDPTTNSVQGRAS